MITVKLSELENAYKEAFHKASPHRGINFELLRELTGEKDPDVHMALVFLEENNTGYDGTLERYLCNTGKNKIAFHVDLIPGFIGAK